MKKLRLSFNSFNLLLIFSLLLAFGCANVKMITPSKFYSESFNGKIDEVRKLMNAGKAQEALVKLHSINEKSLISNSEKAQKQNLEGLILFSKGKYTESLKFFNRGIQFPIEDETLIAQINLNLASTEFKLSNFESSYKNINKIDVRAISDSDEKKLYQLQYLVCLQLSKNDEAIHAMFNFLKDLKDINAIKSEAAYEKLTNTFATFSDSEKMRILDKHDDVAYTAAGLLAYEEAEKKYLIADNDQAKKLAEWVKSNFDDHRELNLMAENFLMKFNYVPSAAVSKGTIGVVLPLTGKKAEFSDRAMKGLNCALSHLFNNSQFRGVAPKLIIRDSKGSGVIGAYQVRDLIEKNSVSIVIGGLFPEEAEEEYLAAKKEHAIFISLSTLVLDKEKKDHFLIEIPGSIESHVHKILSDDFISAAGKRVSIIYPKTEKGINYLNEFWRQALNKGLTITGAQSVPKDIKDVREPVQNLLGLKFNRERSEELELLSNIYKLEQNKNRRVQTLTPKIDYDWVYMPLLPAEALQVIPAFSYFDAFGTTFVGDVSWRTTNFIQGVQRERKIFFVGDKNNASTEEFMKFYAGLYGEAPKVVETFSYEAIKVIFPLLTTLEVSRRDDIEKYLLQQKAVSGISGFWSLIDNVWIKDMNLLNADRGNIKDYTSSAAPAPVSI